MAWWKVAEIKVLPALCYIPGFCQLMMELINEQNGSCINGYGIGGRLLKSKCHCSPHCPVFQSLVMNEAVGIKTPLLLSAWVGM